MRASALWMVLILVIAAGTGQAVLHGDEEPYPQDDGGSGQDASDVCDDPYPQVPRDRVQQGQLVPVLDQVDVWAIAADQGDRLHIEVTPRAQGTPALEITPALTITLWQTGSDGCTEALASAKTSGQTPATLEATMPSTGTYSLEIYLDGLATDVSAQAADPAPDSTHCSPVCATDMNLRVTTADGSA